MEYTVAPEIVRQAGEEIRFNFRFMRVGIGNAKSKEEMLAVMPSLKDFDFRVTDTNDGFVSVWVNKDQYAEKVAADKNEAEKKSMPAIRKALFGTAIAVLTQSVVSGLFVAGCAKAVYHIFKLGVVSFGVVFWWTFAVVLVLSIFLVLLNFMGMTGRQ